VVSRGYNDYFPCQLGYTLIYGWDTLEKSKGKQDPIVYVELAVLLAMMTLFKQNHSHNPVRVRFAAAFYHPITKDFPANQEDHHSCSV